MKQRIVLLSAVLLIMSGLFTACSEEEIDTRQPEEECPEALAELVTADVERFHRLGIDFMVEEMELYPGSDLFDMEFEHVMGVMGEYISDFGETYDWGFDPDPDGLQTTRDAIDLFTMVSGQDTKNWFGILKKQLKSNDEYENDLVDYDKIEMFSQKIGEIITTDPQEKCSDEHLEYIQEKLDELILNAMAQLNDYEVFIVNNMISVGVSSLGSWVEITSQCTKDGDASINWRQVGEIAEADLKFGALGCMANYKKITAASIFGGWAGFLASAGTIFGSASLVGSTGYYYTVLREDPDDPKN